MEILNELVGTKEIAINRPITPEKELLLGILDRAVLDYHGLEPAQRTEAQEWLFEEEDPCSPFSFDWICDNLTLNPSALRRRINLLQIPNNYSQAHRWIRRKIQSRGHVEA